MIAIRCRHPAAIFWRPVQAVEWVFSDCVFQMVGREVGVDHGHFDVSMTEDITQHQYIAAVHHEMAGEGVAQYVGALSIWKLNSRPVNGTLKGFAAGRKQLAAFTWDLIIQFTADGNGSVFLALGAGVGDAIRRDLLA